MVQGGSNHRVEPTLDHFFLLSRDGGLCEWIRKKLSAQAFKTGLLTAIPLRAAIRPTSHRSVVELSTTMSSKTLMEGSAPAYSDAEKGLIDIHEQRPGAVVPAFTPQAPSYPVDEKKALSTTVRVFPAPKEKKEPAPAPTPAPPRPAAKKKKVSKWILFKIWFNTYRYIKRHSCIRISLIDTA